MYLDNSYLEKQVAFEKEACGIIEVYGFVCAMTCCGCCCESSGRTVGRYGEDERRRRDRFDCCPEISGTSRCS